MEEFAGVLRALIATAAGGLLQQGLITQDQITAIAGGVVALAVAAWSIWQKRKAKAVSQKTDS